MESLHWHIFSITILISIVYVIWKALATCWVGPTKTYLKLRRNGLNGPLPNFPLGNLKEMKEISTNASPPTKVISNNIHCMVLPYFAKWKKVYGKVFVYWLGTEPFLHISDPEFLRRLTSDVMGKDWGKPTVFKHDRNPMFGKGLVMVEGNDWIRHRHVITPAFSPSNLKAMIEMMRDSAQSMAHKWSELIHSGGSEIDVEREIIHVAGEIIARASFGMNDAVGREVFDKLRAMQMTLFNSARYVGVPLGRLISIMSTMEAIKLGNKVDSLLRSIIETRRRNGGQSRKDLLGFLLDDTLSTRELIDECKTFFFAGHETTALAITWTLLLLAKHPTWQEQLREEVLEATKNQPIDHSMLGNLKKMKWVMNEVLRLYSPAPNAQRQAREDINMGKLTVPRGTNIWVDVVAMHHDVDLWGDDVYEFKPERFKDDIYGGCKHKMGFLPFGFGGRMCIGRNLSLMEYKIVLATILSRFKFSVSPSYLHAPCIMLSLRPRYGIQLLFEHVNS